MADRILWNKRGVDIDEIVIRDASTVHIEQMDVNSWWIGIYKGDDPDGPYWMGNFTVEGGRLTFTEQENAGIEWAENRTHPE